MPETKNHETRRLCYALDLADDEDLIKEYENYHKKGNVWPEVLASIWESNVEDMEIYRVENRLFMIMIVNADFDEKVKAEMDYVNPKVQEWELLMSNFQRKLPKAKPDEKWVKMARIFSLKDEKNKD